MFGFTRTIKFAAAAFVAAAMLMVTTLPSQADSGTVRLRVGSAGFIIGVGGGSGTLTFHGKTYPLRISGVSLGMIGVSSADLVGRARNLRRPAISQAHTRRSARVLQSLAARRLPRLRNANGVVLQVQGPRSDFPRRSTSADCDSDAIDLRRLSRLERELHWRRYISGPGNDYAGAETCSHLIRYRLPLSPA